MTPLSCPAAKRLISGWAARTQKRSFSRLKVWTRVRLFRSQTRMVLSSPADRIRSWCGWKRQPLAFWKWPRQVSTSQALVSLMRHSLTRRSSPAETMSGMVGWKATQLTPRSWPSSTNLTTASVLPNMSVWAFWRATWSSKLMAVGALCFLRRPEMSQTRTDWSSEPETTRSSLGWNCAHMA
ncbi:hypothetical protein VTK73DRAFT_1974 [Phialemonium thermophilum]|uniref:Uncharacterized protein n=1 Tax=Phialemonium thermophilum TaxID=223376 RepID=A0ABR3VSQ6_9PEZI